MKEYNSAFFNLYEIWFETLKNEFGEEKALELFTKVMETMLKKAYGESFEKNNPQEFMRLVSQRNENVGVKVSFHNIEKNSFIYRFHTDVFPNLKGQVKPYELAKTYIQFKVKYLLGTNWNFKMIKHSWNGADCTDFLIYEVAV